MLLQQAQERSPVPPRSQPVTSLCPQTESFWKPFEGFILKSPNYRSWFYSVGLMCLSCSGRILFSRGLESHREGSESRLYIDH